MFKTIAAVVIAAIVVAGATVAPSLSEIAEANGSQHILKDDRLTIGPAGSHCPQAGWPYYNSACVRGPAHSAALRRDIRIIAIDRLPQQSFAVASAN